MTAVEMLGNGQRWTDDITRYAMPIVLWCAKNGKTISYSGIEKEIIARGQKIAVQEVKQKYGHPAGKIGDIIFQLGEEIDEDIPPVNAIIVSKATGLPSKGVDPYLKKFIKKRPGKRLAKINRDEITKEVMQAVHDYPHWKQVAEKLGYKNLPPVSTVSTQDDTKPIKTPEPKPIKGGGGESKEHKKLKEKVALSPELFVEFGTFDEGVQEYFLRSGDEVDVVFTNDEMLLGVEVKAKNAPEAELVRGIYQCVKYRATLRAMQLADGALPNAQTVLATATPLAGETKRLAKRLKVHWFVVI